MVNRISPVAKPKNDAMALVELVSTIDLLRLVRSGVSRSAKSNTEASATKVTWLPTIRPVGDCWIP